MVKLPWEKPDAYAFFFRPLPHVTGTPPQLLRLMKCPLALSSTPTLGFFFECISIQFFCSPLPLTQSVRLPMVAYPSLCSTWCLMRCHAMPEFTTSFQPNPYLGKRRTSPGVIGILSMHLRLHT